MFQFSFFVEFPLNQMWFFCVQKIHNLFIRSDKHYFFSHKERDAMRHSELNNLTHFGDTSALYGKSGEKRTKKQNPTKFGKKRKRWKNRFIFQLFFCFDLWPEIERETWAIFVLTPFFLNWVQTSVILCGSGSQKKSGTFFKA